MCTLYFKSVIDNRVAAAGWGFLQRNTPKVGVSAGR